MFQAYSTAVAESPMLKIVINLHCLFADVTQILLQLKKFRN
jgi:hypothetical protein